MMAPGDSSAQLVDTDELPTPRLNVEPRDDAALSPLYVLPGKHKMLRVPLKVEFERGEDGILAFAPAVDVGGTGTNATSALTDLLSTACDLLAEFGGSSKKLHWSAKHRYDLLKRVFREP